jgi:hypothetical protein
LEITRLRVRKAANRRLLLAETPDRSPHMRVLGPKEFGGERRHIWRGSVGSRSSHLKGTFLKRQSLPSARARQSCGQVGQEEMVIRSGSFLTDA